MIFTETKLKGAFVLDIERRNDPRGFFARTFCQRDFEAHGTPQQRVAVQPPKRYAAGYALPISACDGDKTRAL